MKQHERDEELANTSTQSIPSKEPSRRPSRASAKVTHSLRQGGSGRFDNGADLIDAALKAPEV